MGCWLKQNAPLITFLGLMVSSIAMILAFFIYRKQEEEYKNFRNFEENFSTYVHQKMDLLSQQFLGN